MALFFDVRRVQILCTCNRICPLSQLYFCRHCYDVRCGNCVSHEVDSHYCPNCLENMASAEAKLRRQRCGNCFDCPICGHVLSTRATLALVPAADAKGDGSRTTAQKTYFLVCGFCRWSTRDSKISDQSAPAGGWQESPNPNDTRIEDLIAAYRHLAVKEKSELEKTKYVKKRNYMLLMSSLAERYPVLTPRFRRYRTPAWNSFRKDSEPSVEQKIPAADSVPITEPFNVNEIISVPFTAESATAVYQRYLMPHRQEISTSKPEPRHKALAVKRSLRCRQCEHNLSKGDFNPSAIKFRINLSAFYHVPDLRISIPPNLVVNTSPDFKCESLPKTAGAEDFNVASLLRSSNINLPMLNFSSLPPRNLLLKGFAIGKATRIILTLRNPAHRNTSVSLRQLTPEEECSRLAVFLTSLKPAPAEGFPRYTTVLLNLPKFPIVLAAKSDVTDYDDLAVPVSNEFITDDPKLIAFRQGSKVGINVDLTPLQLDTPTASGTKLQLRSVIELTFDYQNTTTSILSDQRTATASAVLAASGIKESGSTLELNKSDSPKVSSSTTVDDQRTISVICLVDFGETFVS